MSLGDLLGKLYNLKRDSSSGWEKPYKPALIFALIDMIEGGEAAGNRFFLSDALISRYVAYIDIVKRPGDHAKIHYPFWHLCGDGVWMLYGAGGNRLYRPGENAAESPSVTVIRNNLEHARLDPALFQALSDPIERERIRLALISRYFPSHRQALLNSINRYHQTDRIPDEGTHLERDPARSAAFARVVKDVYDYRCAASGLRFRLEDLTIVDACHLIPFAETGNDHPTNGMALSKNHHWALDRHLIAPFAGETRLVWKVAPCLDDRIEGHKELIKLDDRTVLLPREKRFWPSEEGMQWRWDRLKQSA